MNMAKFHVTKSASGLPMSPTAWASQMLSVEIVIVPYEAIQIDTTAFELNVKSVWHNGADRAAKVIKAIYRDANDGKPTTGRRKGVSFFDFNHRRFLC